MSVVPQSANRQWLFAALCTLGIATQIDTRLQADQEIADQEIGTPIEIQTQTPSLDLVKAASGLKSDHEIKRLVRVRRWMQWLSDELFAYASQTPKPLASVTLPYPSSIEYLMVAHNAEFGAISRTLSSRFFAGKYPVDEWDYLLTQAAVPPPSL